jgi:hypothetical protein
MIHKMKLSTNIDAELIRMIRNAVLGKLFISSKWHWEHWRDGKLIDRWVEQNVMVNEGVTYILDAALSGGSQISTFYLALFEDDHTPVVGNTYASPGYTESTAYDEANRPQWQEAGVSSLSLTNSANKASFTMNATKTIYGAALVGGGTDADTKGDTAGGGKLIAASQFTSGSKSVVDDDVLKVTCAVTGADA